MKGTILNIQRFCTDDGPGIRTTVFLKGFPLRCAWCHNPESQARQSEILYNKNKCVPCGRCVEVCPQKCHSVEKDHSFARRSCIGCGTCAEVCPAKALELYGKSIAADDAYNEVKKDKVFYKTSGGGVTISGGEPLFQPNFTAELLKMCKENGIHTAIETSGFADEKSLFSVSSYIQMTLRLSIIKTLNELLPLRLPYPPTLLLFLKSILEIC